MTMRPIFEIAADVRKNWAKVNYAAVPYLDAMSSLDGINGAYYEDSARSVVAYFLANASTFRGSEAKRIKIELNAMLKS
jgi:hypothetical protein